MPPISRLYRRDSFSNTVYKPILQPSSHEVLSSISHDEPPDITKTLNPLTTLRTLTVPVPKAFYSTILILDNPTPSSSPSPSPSLILTSSPRNKRQASAGQLSSNATVGIVIGCITGFVLLVAVLYVWYLRAARGKKSKKVKKKNGKKKAKKGKRKKRSFKRRVRRYMRRSVRRGTGRGRRRSSGVGLSRSGLYHCAKNHKIKARD
jgi:hypothetical protein